MRGEGLVATCNFLFYYITVFFKGWINLHNFMANWPESIKIAWQNWWIKSINYVNRPNTYVYSLIPLEKVSKVPPSLSQCNISMIRDYKFRFRSNLKELSVITELGSLQKKEPKFCEGLNFVHWNVNSSAWKIDWFRELTKVLKAGVLLNRS